MPGSWLSFLLGAVSVLIQRQHQLGIARAGQYAVPIQGVFADDVGEAGSGLVAGVCTDDLTDGAGQGLAGAAGYVVVNLHGLGDRFFFLLGIVLAGGLGGLGYGFRLVLRDSSGCGSVASWAISGASCAASSPAGAAISSFFARVFRWRGSGQVSGRVPGSK